MKLKSTSNRAAALLATVCLVSLSMVTGMNVHAGAFSTLVSPPRFELESKPGETIRSFLKISNAGTDISNLVIRSADWSLGENAGVIIHDKELESGSCRPWVRLERPKIKIAGKSDKKFRFEIRVPADATVGECRFAILIEAPSEEYDLVSAGNVQFPVSGRIAVIVYLNVGDAKPALDIGPVEFRNINNRMTPAVEVRNLGLAHGRPEGLLEGVDANGKSFLLMLSPLPVLPGEARHIPLWPKQQDGEDLKREIARPARLEGEIIWDTGQKKISQTLN